MVALGRMSGLAVGDGDMANSNNGNSGSQPVVGNAEKIIQFLGIAIHCQRNSIVQRVLFKSIPPALP